MVYQVFNDGIERRQSQSSRAAKRAGRSQARASKQTTGGSFLTSLPPNYLSVKTKSRLAALLIVSIKILLFLYDLISLPIYFVLERPDKRAHEAQRLHSRQVDSCTWMRMHQQTHPVLKRTRLRNELNKSLARWFARKKQPELNCTSWAQLKRVQNDIHSTRPTRSEFMGATMGEVFANSIKWHWSSSCLGYRALVSCPVLTLDEHGEHVMQEKSFRSDYTWYTFGQVGQRVQDIASGLYASNVYPQSRALLLASTSLEWFCTAQACFQLAIELVLAADISDCKILKQILLDEAHCECLFVSHNNINKLCSLIDILEHATGCSRSNDECRCFSLKRIVIIDWPFSIDFSERAFNQLGESLRDLQQVPMIEVLSMGQVEERGIERPIELRCSRSLAAVEQADKGESESDVNQPEWLPESKGRVSRPLASGRKETRAASLSGTVETGQRRLSRGVVNSSAVDLSLGRQAESSSILSSNTKSLELETPRPKPEDVAIISYTFGDLGQLKAILLTHSQLARCTNHLFLDGLVAGQGDVHCALLQLDNLVELMLELSVFSRGGSIGYSDNLETFFFDGKQLFERDKSDLEALRPSFLLVRPYILERLRASLQIYLQTRLNPVIGFVMRNALYEYKKYWAERHYSTPLVDRLFCNKLRKLFGARLEYILCNGAADCSETKDFFAYMLDVPVIELYGPDEAVLSMISLDQSQLGQRHWTGLTSDRQSVASEQRAVSGYGWRLFQFDQYTDETASSYSSADEEEQVRQQEREKEALHRRTANNQATKNKQNRAHLNHLLPPRVNKNVYKKNLSKNILFSSCVLCPTFGTRIRLEDWKDFRLSDQPFPRGRLVIGGDVVCQGYLKTNLADEPQSALEGDEPFEVDQNRINWFRTGDVARALPNGSFEIISAISDLIKMADGQFVSLSQIEHMLRNSCFVDNVCAICGHERSQVIINLVVPNLRRLALKSPGEANLKQLAFDASRAPFSAGANGARAYDEPDELVDVEFRREVCNDRLLSEFVAKHLSELLERSGLAGIKIKFLLVPEIWTPESELVTPAFEPKRDAIKNFYAADIQSIVSSMDAKEHHLSRRLSARRYLLRKSSSPPMLL